MENNNNNGRGIFYGVIGVATLVVAIIGATFAYFSASITQNDVLTTNSTTLQLSITNEASNYKTDLIPVETEAGTGNTDTNGITLFARYPGLTKTDGSVGASTCKDDVGNDICSVYTFEITNPSTTTAQTVVGSLKVTTNDFLTDDQTESNQSNLTYAVFKGRPEDYDDVADNGISVYNVNATAAATVTMNGTVKTDAAVGTLVVARTQLGGAGTTYDWANTVERLDPGESSAYTVVVWLEETGSLQDDDQGNAFAASITFTSNQGGGVTGVLSAGN